MPRTARLIVGDRAPPIESQVIDYSAGGACLDVDLAVIARLPQRLELHYGANRKKCRIVWTRGRRVGVCF
jgi:hypothetical protein